MLAQSIVNPNEILAEALRKRSCRPLGRSPAQVGRASGAVASPTGAKLEAAREAGVSGPPEVVDPFWAGSGIGSVPKSRTPRTSTFGHRTDPAKEQEG